MIIKHRMEHAPTRTGDAPAEAVKTAPAVVAGHEPRTAGGAESPLSKLVAAFHLELAAIRGPPSGKPSQSSPFEAPGPDGSERSGNQVAGGSAGTFESTLSIEAAEPVEIIDVADPEPVDTRFLCPICEARTDREPISFRGTAMCPSCSDLLRGY